MLLWGRRAIDEGIGEKKGNRRREGESGSMSVEYDECMLELKAEAVDRR